MAARSLSKDERLYLRDALRAARGKALQDSEQFTQIIVAIERLGSLLGAEGKGLGRYRSQISTLVAGTALADAVASTHGSPHTSFATLYELVRRGRNEALHEGAFARHLTASSVELALFIEDALMGDMDRVSDFMVRGVIVARLWQPVSFVRQALLENSFSYLPVWIPQGSEGAWRLVSDHGIARFLRAENGERGRSLAQPLQEAITSGKLRLEEPFICTGDCSVSEALAGCRGLPILIRGPEPGELLGIATPFDLM